MKQDLQKNKADFWTNMNCFGSAVVTMTSNTYFFIALLKLIMNSSSDNDSIGEAQRNWLIVVFAVIISSIITAGDAYTEWVLNSQYQKKFDYREELASLQGSINNSDLAPDVSLSTGQKFALGCDWVGNAINVALPLKVAGDVVIAPVKLWEKIGLSMGCIFFGAVAKYASVRTSEGSIKAMNAEVRKLEH